MAEQSWYIQSGDKVVGPVDAKKLRALAAAGKLTEQHYVRLGEAGEWIRAGSVRGLFTASRAAQPCVEPVRQPPLAPPPLSMQPSHAEEFTNDRRRLLAAVSIAPEKFDLIQGFLMDHEQPLAMAVQRQFPFSIFADIVLLTSHRLILFERFFTKITMHDVNYMDIGNVRVNQGYFTSLFRVTTVTGVELRVERLITEQALALYRRCQDVETKARMARHQFRLEENRSRATNVQVNNVTGSPRLYTGTDDAARVDAVGQEVSNPYRLMPPE